MAVRKTTTTKRAVARKPTAKSRATYGIQTSYGGKKESSLGYVMSKLDKAEAKATRKKSRVETRAAKSAYREASRKVKTRKGSSSKGGSYTTTPDNKYVYKGSYKTAKEAPVWSNGVLLNREQSRPTKVEYTKNLSSKLRKAKKELVADERFDRTSLGVTKQSKKSRNLYAKEVAARTLGMKAKADRVRKRRQRVEKRPGNAAIRQADKAYAASGFVKAAGCAKQGDCYAVGANKTRFDRRENRQTKRSIVKYARKTSQSGAGKVLESAAGKVSRKLGAQVRRVQNKKIAKAREKYAPAQNKVKGTSALIIGPGNFGAKKSMSKKTKTSTAKRTTKTTAVKKASPRKK
jgi:hypothetical protein